VADAEYDSVDQFMGTMQQLLVGGGAQEQDIVLPERLDRTRLDFSRESLHVLDDYLNEVHDSGDTAVGLSLLTTIWAAALYVGEIIRRAAPHRHFQWVTISETEASSTGATTQQFSLGSLRALRAQDGELCLPSRAVLRVILRGRKARSLHSFARGAIEATDSPEPPPGGSASPSFSGAFAG
jgi:hypothetical protein